MSTQVTRVAENASWKEIDGLVIVVNVETGAYYSLNETASVVWTLAAGGATAEAIADHVCSGYDVPEPRVRADVARCLEEWMDSGLMVVVDGDKGGSNAG